jgi:hypothetical protein
MGKAVVGKRDAMNFYQSFQLPRQSFPTDVTSPTPTQLPSPPPEAADDIYTVPPAKPPKSERAEDEPDEEKRASHQSDSYHLV